MGTIFPFELTKWLVGKLSKLECIMHAVLLNDRDSWVVGDQTTSMCDTSYKALLTIGIINAKNISKRVQSIYKRTKKTPITIVRNKNLSVEDCFSLVDNIAISDFHNNNGINSDLVNLLNEKGSSIITPSGGFFNKITYMFMSYIMESLTTDDNNYIEFFTNNDRNHHEIKMTDGCPCCLSNVQDAVHMCSAIQASNEKCIVVVSTSFEKEFDVESFEERFISGSNIRILPDNSKFFFYSSLLRTTPAAGGGKDIDKDVLVKLSNMLDDCRKKRDEFRPASETVRTNKIQMCLSRIDNPFKKTNNEKGEMKLTSHARVLNELGNSWITAKVYNEMYMISLLDTKPNSCYIEKSKDYQAFNGPCYKIITRSTLYKLDNYF